MIDRIQFLFAEGLLSLRRNGWMTFAAITTVAVALFLIGGLGYVYGQLRSGASQLTGLFEMRASIVDGTPASRITIIAGQIRRIPGVKSVNWIPRDKAWNKYLDEHPENREYADIENPYPDMFKITLSDLKSSERIVESVKSTNGINREEVKYLSDVADLIVDLQAIVSWLGLVVGGVLFITAGVLIYNAIRLTVISRRLEIRIMQLVGASFLTVRIPFYIEGLIQGALGGVLATIVLFACQEVVEFRLPEFFANVKLPPFPWAMFLTILPFLGAAYGLLCSMIAVRTPLRYR
ncbi:MAG TPA: permease-like cell division protein FtsX [Fimbriimonadaceae bacterium]|nr:permease-like cell division protein FtsX [Fimbriimonadaceae bacterium]